MHDLLNAYTVARMDSQKIPMRKTRKLTREQIREGVKSAPVVQILTGVNETGAPAITAKQMAFVEEYLKGQSMAESYRVAYNSKGNPNTCSRRGRELLDDSRIQAYMAHRKAQIMGDKSQNPMEIRRETIRSLLIHAQDESFPPAQRVKCLELLGKITEVALFTERREVVRVTDANDAKAKLFDALRDAMKRNALTVDAIIDKDVDTLTEEIQQANSPDAIEPDGDDDPPTATPQNPEDEGAGLSHSIPHTESGSNSNPPPIENGPPETAGGVL